MRRVQIELSGAVQCSAVQQTRLFRVCSAGAGLRCSSMRGLRGLAVEEARSESRDGGGSLWEPKGVSCRPLVAAKRVDAGDWRALVQ